MAILVACIFAASATSATVANGQPIGSVGTKGGAATQPATPSPPKRTPPPPGADCGDNMLSLEAAAFNYSAAPTLPLKHIGIDQNLYFTAPVSPTPNSSERQAIKELLSAIKKREHCIDSDASGSRAKVLDGIRLSMDLHGYFTWPNLPQNGPLSGQRAEYLECSELASLKNMHIPADLQPDFNQTLVLFEVYPSGDSLEWTSKYGWICFNSSGGPRGPI